MKKLYFGFLALIFFIVGPTPALAQHSCTFSTGIIGTETVFGCIPNDPKWMVRYFVIPTAVGVAGGIAFLMFVYSAFILLTSGGDPKAVQKGQEIFVSALSGLLIILFSVFLLRFIGYDILRLPGFIRV